jgi:hypothetical protein
LPPTSGGIFGYVSAVGVDRSIGVRRAATRFEPLTSFRNIVMLCPSLAAAMISGLAAVPAPQASTQVESESAPSAEVLELRERVARLEGRLTQMAEAEGDRWLGEQRAADIRELVRDVVADADSRASLQASAATSGFEKGKGFFVRSEDGNFLFRFQALFQFRYVWNRQDNSPTDDYRYGFENRRSKLFFRGHFIDPSWTYDFELTGSRSTGTISEGESFAVQKDFGGGLSVRFGQFKPAFLREEMVSSAQLVAVERSNVNSRYTAGITQGVQMQWTSGMFRAHAALIDGFKTAASPGWNTEDSEFAGTARIELLPIGEWKDAANDTGFRGTGTTLLFGAALAYAKSEFGTSTNDNETDDLRASLDAMFKTGGFGLAGAFVYRKLETDGNAPAPIDRDEIAFVVRGGFFVADDLELFAAYEWGDDDIAGSPDLSTATVGVTKYFSGSNLKWSTDVGYGFDTVSVEWADAGAGWRPDAAGEDGQIVVRSQFQLMF